MCSLCFQGKGYSDEFVENFFKIVNQLREENGDDVEIEVVAETDDVCAPCPSRREKLCTKQVTIDQLDENHANVLRLKPGDVLTWGEAKQRIKEYMSLENFHQACAPCSWKSLGICEKILREHSGKHQEQT